MALSLLHGALIVGGLSIVVALLLLMKRDADARMKMFEQINKMAEEKHNSEHQTMEYLAEICCEKVCQ